MPWWCGVVLVLLAHGAHAQSSSTSNVTTCIDQSSVTCVTGGSLNPEAFDVDANQVLQYADLTVFAQVAQRAIDDDTDAVALAVLARLCRCGDFDGDGRLAANDTTARAVVSNALIAAALASATIPAVTSAT